MEQLETRITPALLSTSLVAPYGLECHSTLLMDQSGNLYGTAADGGAAGDGTVFELVHGSNTLTTLASFNGTNGANPYASLIMDGSGNLYGTTVNGGTAGDGTVFELANGSSTVTTLATFAGANGANPEAGLVMDPSGNLYGTTANGGTANDGTVFELSAGSSTITTLASFNGTDGADPLGVLIRDSAGNLYGTAKLGGDSNDGTVFEVAAGGGAITTVGSFNGSNGNHPVAGLLMDGSGNLYGTTQNGGASEGGGLLGYGTVFEVAHGSGTITALASFNFDGSSGANPTCSLVMDGNGNLYGTTQWGPDVVVEGTVFELAAGSGTITTLAPFKNYANGAVPLAGLVMDGSGNLYGTTRGVGPGQGTVFELAPGSGTLTVLARFDDPGGAHPQAGVVTDSSGNLYGTAVRGGTFNDGAVFELAAGSGAIAPLASFNGTNGSFPEAGMVLDSSGNLYGTTIEGGTSNDGTVFEVAAGSGTITDLASFNGSNGADPLGGLVLDSSGNLYGTTKAGGTSNNGTVFEIAHGSGTLTTLASFGGGSESGPFGTLLMDGEGNLYGTTAGATAGAGAVFELGAGSGSITTLATFANGYSASGGLVRDGLGNLYGTTYGTSVNPASVSDTIFEVVAGSGTITTLASFDGTNGSEPTDGLLMDSSGNLYGTTVVGGASNEGTVFELAQGSGTITALASFDGTNGVNPQGSLLMDGSGKLYGTAENGGSFNFGTVFELVRGITLSPAILPAASVGASYSQTLTASGGTAPYTFAVTAGSLPDGLSLSADGALNGTPTAAGSFSFTVTATDQNSKTGSQPYTLTVGLPAASLSVTGFPSPTTAGVAGTFTVTALNADGTVDTHYPGTVHFTSSDPQAALPADYAFTAGDLGVHSFSATLKTAGAQSLTAADAGDTSVVGAEPVTVLPAAADHWTFTQQPPNTTAGQTIDGSTVPAGVRVGLFDPFNNLETGDSGDTVTLAVQSGPSSRLLGSLTQTVSGGLAVFGDLAIDTAGSYVLQASSATQSALPAVGSASFVISPAAPDHLTFTQQPTDTTAGQTINAGTTPAGVRVGLYDAFGNLETGEASDAVTLAVQSGPSRGLLGTLTQTANGGVAVFPDLSLNTAGSYTLQASSSSRPALAPAPSAGFVISPTGFDHLAFAQQPTDTPAGQAIDGNSVPAGVRVGLFDRFGNLETGDRSDSVALAVQSGPSRSLLGTLTQSVSGGMAVFPDLSLDTAGSYILQASSPTQPDLAAITSARFVISPAAPDHLAFTQQPTDTTAGQAIDAATAPAGLRVGLLDRYNNPEAGDSSDTVRLAIRSGPGSSLLGTPKETVRGGVAVFPDLSLDAAGGYTLVAGSPTQPALAAIVSAGFAISPAAPDHLAFVQQPTETTAGATISPPVTVQVLDRFNNPTTTAGVTLALNGASLGGTRTQAAGGGVVTFNNLSINVADTGWTLTASSPGLGSVASAAFTITPAPVTNPALLQPPASATAGQASPLLSMVFGPVLKLRGSRRHPVSGRYFEEVSLFNAADQPVAGPFALVLLGLSARPVVRHHHVVMRSTRIRLLDASGFTAGVSAPGSPYLFDVLNVQQLDSTQGATFVLNFSDPLNRPIRYSPLLIAGELP